jgi:dienelactone hydrolase
MISTPVFLLLVIAPPSLQAPAPLAPAEVRTAFLKLLDRPRVPLDPRTDRTDSPVRGLVAEHVRFASEKHPDGSLELVPTLVVRPEDATKKRPAVIVLHGTGGTKEGSRPWLDDLARRGFVAVAIDGRYHGERAGGAKGADAYNRAIIKAWRSKPGEPQEHPFYYDTCWDVWRTIDYLQTRPDVDPDRIGLIGFSKGGIETYLAGAVDERVKVAIPAIAVQGFAWGLEHDRWQGRAKTIGAAHDAVAKDLGEPKVNPKVCRALWAKIVPGITAEFDGPSMLRLFAGRPLLILNGSEDPNCPIEGARTAFASAESAYREAKAGDKLKVMVAEGVGHAVTDEQRAAALAWLVRWLKP